jgi:hypothetical protein
MPVEIAVAKTTLVFETEIWDTGGNYDNTTYIFTAPVTGKYYFFFEIWEQDTDKTASWLWFKIETSNRTHNFIIDPAAEIAADTSFRTYTMSVITDMDASDTASVNRQQSGGAAQSDLSDSYFGGYLVG